MLRELKNKLLEKLPDNLKKNLEKSLSELKVLKEKSKENLKTLLNKTKEVVGEGSKIFKICSRKFLYNLKIILDKFIENMKPSLLKLSKKVKEVFSKILKGTRENFKKLQEKLKIKQGNKIIIGVLALFVSISIFVPSFIMFKINSKDYYTKTIIIGKGSNLGKILKEINPDKEFYFKLYLKFTNGGKKIKTGYYPLEGDYSVKEIVELLETGQDKLVSFTIPEGLTIKEIVAKLETEKGIDTKKFYEELKKVDFPYPTPKGNFEGYFYPETYFIPEHASEKSIIDMMLGEFLKKYPPENYPDKEEFYKKLVLASIIEREAMLPSEKPIISSVFHNRLKIGMQLASDATVNYLYDYSKRRMYYKDLEIDSPYNTYKYKGLPPGPIGNPDKASIDASFNPAQTKYYFFVTSQGGAHHFTRTYKEHLEFQRRNKK